MRGGFRRYWEWHRPLFWRLHSIWALVAGGVVVFLAHERYGFVPWVLLFLLLTWSSTLWFGRTMVDDPRARDPSGPLKLHREVASYLTRIMYQETLFFTLPFYWYSTVVESPNVVFSIVLVGLAILSCLDLVFDRWFRTRYLFRLAYFATVTFAASNLIIPMLLPLGPAFATPFAAILAVGSSIPLVGRPSPGRWSGRVSIAALAAAFLVLAAALPQLVPPVPLRLKSATFTSDLDRATLVPADSLPSSVASDQLGDALFILAEVFSPSNLPTRVSVQWRRNGEVFRTSRDIEIVAHEMGFRIWDSFRSEAGRVEPGVYEVVLRTAGNRVFGKAGIRVTPH